jgi:ABC-type transport system involved in cytochrome c biogenesis permease subunit
MLYAISCKPHPRVLFVLAVIVIGRPPASASAFSSMPGARRPPNRRWSLVAGPPTHPPGARIKEQGSPPPANALSVFVFILILILIFIVIVIETAPCTEHGTRSACP